MSGQSVNLQDGFLNQVRKEGIEVEVMLLSGSVFQGHVKGFDNFTLIMHVDGKQHLIYKHAIAQMIAPRFAAKPRAEHEPAENVEHHAEAAPARHNGAKRREAKPEQQKEEAKPEKFNAIDLSGIKLDSGKTK